MLLVRVAVVAWKADIDMLPGIAGVVWMRETHREGSKAVARNPSASADQLIEGGV